ncbi:hypothetical protein EC973_007114 [Apophysomyces ossiformis]|uniref:Uncharacterized protein n=1 Tax=Apophysomyces ossiformis TaxID=679940 RepID=A0A8H7BVK4_9FUNG|nr:hypothetical protein EC973_007114 [Apophysomyces ossiformis]
MTQPHSKEVRDPILEDDHFSLRYGNPIQVIHDTPRHTIDTFEPSDPYVPAPVVAMLGTEKREEHKTLKKSSSFIRDTTSFADFCHKDGGVTEIDHEPLGENKQ